MGYVRKWRCLEKNSDLECFYWRRITCDPIVGFVWKTILRIGTCYGITAANFSFLRFVVNQYKFGTFFSAHPVLYNKKWSIHHSSLFSGLPGRCIDYIKLFNPRLCTPAFLTRTCSGGGWCDPPCVSKLRIIELSRRHGDCSRRVLANGGAFFYPWSIFDPVMRGRGSNFRKIDSFST